MPNDPYDSLLPLQQMIVETLIARHRLGEQVWTFARNSSVSFALKGLQQHGFVEYKDGVVERTHLAWLSDKGEELWLSRPYTPPIMQQNLDYLDTVLGNAVRKLVNTQQENIRTVTYRTHQWSDWKRSEDKRSRTRSCGVCTIVMTEGPQTDFQRKGPQGGRPMLISERVWLTAGGEVLAKRSEGGHTPLCQVKALIR